MSALLLVMRLVHIGLGAFWFGAVMFATFFLFPAMQEAGPDGARVGAGVMRRRYPQIVAIVAFLTLLSGLWLLRRVSGGFQPGYMGTGPGKGYSVGGAAAILAFLIGMIFVRPAMTKAMRLGQEAATSPNPQSVHAEAAKLRARAMTAGMVVAVLLMITIAAMALGRYL